LLANGDHLARRLKGVYDLVLRGGTIVTAGSEGVGDVGVDGGRIVQLGGPMQGEREIDLTGLHLLPGGIDVHVHLSTPSDDPDREHWVDDFDSGSEAALGGGVTTIGNMTFQRRGESLREALDRDLARARDQARIDYLLHPVLTDPTPAALEEVPALAAEGHRSLKLFMTLDDFDARLEAYTRALAAAGQAGSITMVHCEDHNSLRCACEALFAAGAGRDLHRFGDSRPVAAERLATQRAVDLARITGAPLYVVHLSSEAALRVCREARAEGLPVYVETRPLYLHLTGERFAEPEPGRYTGAPALRTPRDRERLWDGLAAGDIQTCGTDHAPWRLVQKLDPALDVRTARQGVADLETMLPMLLSEGVRSGRMSLPRFVEVTSTNPARLFGLYPRKGTIALGADADLVAWDLGETRTIDGASMRSRADYSVYDGWEVRGWPAYVLSRGEMALEGGEVRARPGRGRWLARGSTQRL
jgi:dihydropyrimidinase